ncbi:hypothetical protein MCGE09_00241 [Thaumarchaeota archaeon SCGC AB-539-E09]|nr:hypothetical protein MCGE09_00660 [Thaumarchaeota archaeon SCGC AB-539-E09]EMR74309.1 hypothetical protein MCGE09_00241 [Thaumarchaeota archaeon SCGC AB-539-E09]
MVNKKYHLLGGNKHVFSGLQVVKEESPEEPEENIISTFHTCARMNSFGTQRLPPIIFVGISLRLPARVEFQLKLT